MYDCACGDVSLRLIERGRGRKFVKKCEFVYVHVCACTSVCVVYVVCMHLKGMLYVWQLAYV